MQGVKERALKNAKEWKEKENQASNKKARLSDEKKTTSEEPEQHSDLTKEDREMIDAIMHLGFREAQKECGKKKLSAKGTTEELRER